MACYHEALEYAKGRQQFGRPIAGFQLVQQELVHMLTEITKAQLLSMRLGRLKEAGRANPAQISSPSETTSRLRSMSPACQRRARRQRDHGRLLYWPAHVQSGIGQDL
jgi:alkylation response protein AidB-like acyl-CoA dehydrogenase